MLIILEIVIIVKTTINICIAHFVSHSYTGHSKLNFSFEVIVDSHAVIRNDSARSHVSILLPPYLQIFTILQWYYSTRILTLIQSISITTRIPPIAPLQSHPHPTHLLLEPWPTNLFSNSKMSFQESCMNGIIQYITFGIGFFFSFLLYTILYRFIQVVVFISSSFYC